MKSTQHKFLIKITLLFFFLKVLVVNAQYLNNSWSYNYDKFIVGQVSGGGGVSASVNNNVFTLNFSASWSPETFLKQGFIVSLDNYATTLPNTELPIPVGTFFSDKGYRFYLINNKIYIHGNSPLPLTSFSSSLTVNLLSPVTIPAETISFLSSNSGQNKIVTTEYLTNQGTSGNKNVFIMYYDGLGRELQQVNVGYTPQGKDLIQPFEYDSYGRKAKDYLPIPSSQNTGFLISPSSIATLASTTYNGEPAFAEKIFDDSPLNRVAKQAAPGLDWQKNSGHEVKFVYDVNTSSDNVKKYGATTSLVGDLYNTSFVNAVSNYDANSLSKKIVKDEDWISTDGNNRTTEEYTNKEGQTVLIRKYVSGNKVDTYYIFDIYGNLTYVVPPLASAKTTIDQTTLDNLCYQYKYDKRNRLVEKKIPGKGLEYMVYDKQDRLVATQDALLATTTNNFGTKGWLFTKYDQFGRVIYTGFKANTSDRNTLQTSINTTTNPSNNETRSTTTFTNSGMEVYYTNSAFPTVANTDKLLSINYYDNYPSNYSFSPALPPDILGQLTLASLNVGVSRGSTKTLSVSSFVKNIEDDNWTKSYTWYDTKARPIGTYSFNYLGGYTKTETLLDFTGVPQKTFTTHNRTGLNYGTVNIEETFTYDNQNRLLKHEHNVNNQPIPEIIAENTYNEIGQLEIKKVGGTGTPLQTVNYKYNIRGWITDMNNPVNATTMGTDLFGYKIRYNKPIAGLQTPDVLGHPNLQVMPRYNGNIAEIDWNAVDETGVPPQSEPYRYGYVYDPLNRLQAGFYQEPGNPGKGTNNEIIDEYDLNGNIKKLKRFAYRPKSTTPAKIDDLTYLYTGNQVTNIADTGNSSGYEGGNGLIEYDANGNMTKMPDKGITNIIYNYLNLPQEIVQANNTKYFYRADGVKIKKTYTLNNSTGAHISNTEYLDGFQYITNVKSVAQAFKQTDDNTLNAKTAGEDEVFVESEELIPVAYQGMILSFFPTAEGFYDYSKNQYIYQYKDHLGNVRLSYAKNTTTNTLDVLDRNDYYPFGMNFVGYKSVFDAMGSGFNLKYNGKELQETGFYDYGARMYMPDIGRWGVVDPLAEVSRRWSPYNYVLNNPISYIDPDGRLTVNSIQQMWDNTISSSTWTNNGNGNFDGGENSSSGGPGPNGSWGGVNWSKFVNNWNYEDTVEHYRTDVRARTGTLTSVNGNAKLKVKQTVGQWDKEYGFLPVNRFNFANENAMTVTNCYGYVLTNGYFFVDDSVENVRNFLLDSGYKSAQAAGKSFKVGDILLWDGHMIEATGGKGGNVVWSSYFGFDSSPVKGSLNQIMDYNKTFGRDYGSLQGATLYRQQDQSKIQFGQKKYEAVDVKTIQQQKNSY